MKVVLVMELGICMCHWYFLLRTYLRKRLVEDPGPEGKEAQTPNEEAKGKGKHCTTTFR
jgi:hypothetical protein